MKFNTTLRSLPFPSLVLALLSGAVTVFSFAPFGWWFVSLLSMAVVFLLALRARSIRDSALIGWAFGFGWSVAGVHWLFVSMYRFGGMPAWMAALAVTLLSLYMGLFSGMAMAAGVWFRKRWAASDAIAALLILPGLWAISEWMRGWVFTGFPWVASGYAHSNSLLAGYAPLLGVYGLGWAAALIGGCIALLPAAAMRTRAALCGLAIAILAAGYGLSQIEWTKASGKPISVRLLQGNVPQEMKFAREQIVSALVLYRDLITAEKADLIATPETAVPVFARQLPPDYLPRLAEFANKTGSRIALGIPVNDSAWEYSNSVVGIQGGAPAGPGQFAYRYDKHHLVPFGEFIPSGFRWFVNMMRIPLGDFERGPALQAPFAVGDQQVLPNICYEDLFGEEIADQIAAGFYSGRGEATILLNMSNIAWFGDTIALPQHLQISQLRALETGRPMLRSTNTGATAVIDQKGRVAARLQHYSQGTLAATVQGYRGATPYIRFGNTAFLVLSIALLAAARFAARRRRF